MARTACTAAALALLLAGAPSAEIYRWTDAEGRTHFTQDLTKVPPEHRRAARERAGQPSAPSLYQRVEGGEEAAPPAAPDPGARADDGPRTWRIPVQRAGTHMRVDVRLDDSVTAPFLIDTGASDVVIPKAVADALGLRPGPDARTMVYNTANGLVEQPVVMLRSVQVGGARVEDVPASISSTMQVGLLGLSFFNHFTYRVDAAAGVVTLTPNGLARSGAIRGGRSEAQWRAAYGNLRSRMDRVEAERARTPGSRSRKLDDLAAARTELERQLEALEAEADAARVPMRWRE